MPSKTIHYSIPSDSIQILHPSARTITHEGRSGVHFTSIRGRASIPQHALDEPQGALSLWVLPMQDFFPATHHKNHGLNNRHYDRFVFLSDHESIQELEAASFKLYFSSGWYPCLMAKFERGGKKFWRRTGAQAGHFEMHALKWYHLLLAWDRKAEQCALYANGVKVAVHDVTKTENFQFDRPAPRLYFGNPSYAMGDISFYDECLTDEQAGELFEQEVVVRHEAVQQSLRKTYCGENLPEFLSPTLEGWQLKQSLALSQESDFAYFYHQGCGDSVNFTPEGFRITTPAMRDYASLKTPPGPDGAPSYDMTRMYLWTRQAFEGDLCVRVAFKLHQPGGLALLMTQAAGMQGEDFMEDYPRRSDGAMSMVCWEDVRNYHWEFYREMTDCRNDLASHACIKNPWFRPLAYQVENRRWELDRWYQLTYIQEGNRIRGAIDNTTVIDVADNGFDNNGPVLRNGHIAIRCMMRSDITFRNLDVWTRPSFDQSPLPAFREQFPIAEGPAQTS